MKILIYGINYYPEYTGIGKYSSEMVEILAEYGNDVKVVTAYPYYPEWKLRDNYKNHFFLTEIVNGVEVHRCPIWVPNNPTTLKRIIHYASFGLSSFFCLMRLVFWKPQVIFVVVPSIFSAPLPYIFSKIINAKTWLHIQDFEIDIAFSLGFLKNKRIQKIIKYFEIDFYKKFEKISTISKSMLKKLSDEGIDRKKLYSLHNWVDTNVIFPKNNKGEIKNSYGITSNVKIILYSGNLGKKQSVEIILNLAGHPKLNSSILFIICGSGSELSNLKNKAQNLANVRFMFLQPIEKFNDFLNMADMHILPQKSEINNLVMPSKLTGILSVGGICCPILDANDEMKELFSKIEIPIFSETQIEKIVEWINGLIFDESKIKKLSHKAREYALHELDKKMILERLNNELHELVG